MASDSQLVEAHRRVFGGGGTCPINGDDRLGVDTASITSTFGRQGVDTGEEIVLLPTCRQRLDARGITGHAKSGDSITRHGHVHQQILALVGSRSLKSAQEHRPDPAASVAATKEAIEKGLGK